MKNEGRIVMKHYSKLSIHFIARPPSGRVLRTKVLAIIKIIGINNSSNEKIQILIIRFISQKANMYFVPQY